MKQIIIAFLLLIPIFLYAQDIEVVSFGIAENSAALKFKDRVQDENGNYCALIKIITLDKDLSFSGDIVGNVVNRMNEYWVFVKPGTSAIKISSNNNMSKQIVFADYQAEALLPNLQYSLVLKSRNQNNNTDPSQILENVKTKAENGDVGAQCELGKFYSMGKGVSQDYYEAKRWFAAAADKGHAEAQYRLGNCYARGQGVSEKNYLIAVKYYKLAANQNFADALFALGNCYAKGLGVEQDTSLADDYYRRAAQLGHKEAKNKLEMNQ